MGKLLFCPLSQSRRQGKEQQGPESRHCASGEQAAPWLRQKRLARMVARCTGPAHRLLGSNPVFTSCWLCGPGQGTLSFLTLKGHDYNTHPTLLLWDCLHGNPWRQAQFLHGGLTVSSQHLLPKTTLSPVSCKLKFGHGNRHPDAALGQPPWNLCV